MTADDPTPPQLDSPHPSLVELSTLLDRELVTRQAEATSTHLDGCPPCREQLESLMWARQALASAGEPVAPVGASDRAVVAALFVTSLSLVAQAARESTSAPEASPATAGLTPSVEDASADTRPASSSTPAAGLLPLSAGVPALSRGVAPALPRTRVPVAAPASAHWVPPLSTDSDHARTRALVRDRRVRLTARAAAVVLVLGALGGGLAVVLGSNPSAPSTAGPQITSTTGVKGIKGGPSHTATTTASGGPVQAVPAVGALELQLRRETGPSSCTNVTPQRIATVNGTLKLLNPLATSSPIVRLPGPSGSTPKCVSVGPAFAILWSGNVTRISLLPSTASSTVDVVIDVAPSGLATAASLNGAEGSADAIEVVGQGMDIGTAVITNGAVITVPVNKSEASFLEKKLGAN